MKKVVTGQQFRPKATTWNSFIDAAVYVKQRQSNRENMAFRKDTKSGLVIVRNSTDEDLGQFAVVMLGALIITPENNEQEFRSNVPVFEAEKPGEENYEKPLAVLQKPLKKGQCGFAMLSGITPVKLNVESEDQEYAEASSAGLVSSDSGTIRILWKEEGTGKKWALIQLGYSAPSAGGQQFFPAKTTGNGIGGFYPVDIYDEKNGSVIGTGNAMSLQLHVSEQIPVGTWIIVHESLIKALTWN